tara:strand:- start:167 stop:640 length:474 start_codon:yes stop_codon:yes gene_type:complete
MTQTTLWVFIAISTCVAVFLLFYILKLWKKVKELEAIKTDMENKQRKSFNDFKLEAGESIKIIAQSMIDEQVDLSEGSIRIKVLLDHIAPELHEDLAFSIFSKMYTATEHMPTHEARKQADKQLITKLDKERFKLEEENKTDILNAAKALLQKELLR